MTPRAKLDAALNLAIQAGREAGMSPEDLFLAVSCAARRTAKYIKPSSFCEETKRRFWSKVKLAPSGCGEWQGKIGRNGYGKFRDFFAHRVAYELANGPITNGLFVCHSCDNKRCCNPEHLWLGTNKENQQDYIAKGLRVPRLKTHCHRGHEFTPENTYVTPGSGIRHCWACRRDYAREYYDSNKEEIWRKRRERRAA